MGKNNKKFINSLKEVFLPKGYPNSVTNDYIEYQIWDSLQAFASSINGALATQAVLKGVGVGNENATALAATITWLIKDGSGMIGRILFTWKKSNDLDRYSKTWRLMADILNDVSFFIDIISVWISYYPLFFMLLCISSILKSIVGVAGGVTRTVVVQHQAINDNIGDVAAKDGSQETLLNLVSLISSVLLLPLVHENHVLIWICFIIFTTIHIFSNYKAVRSLKFNIFNQETYSIAVKEYLNGNINNLNIDYINKNEPLFVSNLSKKRYLGYNISTRKKDDDEWYVGDSYKIIIKDGITYINFYDSSTIESQFKALFNLEYGTIKAVYSEDIKSYEIFKNELIKNGWNMNKNNFGIDKEKKDD
uniref:DUF647 domain-containing protein n=1 Tax=Parastrongyloides trichosuri TaxID=131310 RepID=A0A0N4ZMN3_PARTI